MLGMYKYNPCGHKEIIMGIKENTVSAEKQTRERGNVFYYGSEKADKKILIVGNSITYHAPKEDIDWNNSWGMAASRAENDYVHILTGTGKYNGGSACGYGGSDQQRQLLRKRLCFGKRICA